MTATIVTQDGVAISALVYLAYGLGLWLARDRAFDRHARLATYPLFLRERHRALHAAIGILHALTIRDKRPPVPRIHGILERLSATGPL